MAVTVAKALREPAALARKRSIGLVGAPPAWAGAVWAALRPCWPGRVLRLIRSAEDAVDAQPAVSEPTLFRVDLEPRGREKAAEWPADLLGRADDAFVVVVAPAEAAKAMKFDEVVDCSPVNPTGKAFGVLVAALAEAAGRSVDDQAVDYLRAALGTAQHVLPVEIARMAVGGELTAERLRAGVEPEIEADAVRIVDALQAGMAADALSGLLARLDRADVLLAFSGLVSSRLALAREWAGARGRGESPRDFSQRNRLQPYALERVDQAAKRWGGRVGRAVDALVRLELACKRTDRRGLAQAAIEALLALA